MSTRATHTKANNGNLPLWTTAILMVLGSAVFAALYWNQNVTINSIEVAGTHYTSIEEIEQAINVPLGIKLDSLDLNEVVVYVERLTYVKDVIPYIEPNGDLHLSIKERTPLAVLVDRNNRVYVDEDGVRLPIMEGKTKNLPLVYGFKAHLTSDTLQTTAFVQIKDFLVNARNNEFGWATISEATFSHEDGVVALSHENGVKLLFGSGDFETKLRNWKAFYVEVIRTKGIQHLQQVDLRFANQVVAKKVKS